MKVLYFDCFAGISGDMTLGAFLDIGADPAHLERELAKLGVPGFHLEIDKTQKRGITGTKCRVVMDGHEHAHRHFSDIVDIIEGSGLDEAVKKTAIAIFRRVAEAEGKVHGVPMEQVHFHEVGAVDSIVDIVGAAICFHDIAPDVVLGSERRSGLCEVRPRPAASAGACHSGDHWKNRFSHLREGGGWRIRHTDGHGNPRRAGQLFGRLSADGSGYHRLWLWRP